MARLSEFYANELRQKLVSERGYTNIMQVPRLEKIVLNMGVGDALQDKKRLEAAYNDLMLIAGQKPVITKAKKSIAGFKLREGVGIGAKVTLRKTRMYEFLDRLVTIALPRIRDFRGISSKSFDGNGNYTLGIKEHTVFPEIDFDKVEKVRGLDIIIVTSAQSDEESLALLKGFNMPFAKKGN